MDIELAWAAGLFDGEGNVRYNSKSNNLNLAIDQKDRFVLDRFKLAIKGYGSVSGPYHPYKIRTIYKYRISGIVAVVTIMNNLLPYLSTPKRYQWEETLRTFKSEWPIRAKYDIANRKSIIEALGI